MNQERTNRFDIHRQHDDWDQVHEQMIEVQEQQRVQKKSLAVSDPGDADEKEADEVARKVAGGESTMIHGTSGSINRKGEGSAETSPEFQSQLESSKGGGQSLPGDVQEELGAKMGADFSEVKIHTGSEASAMNTDISAKAFAHGKDIYFNEGNYNPQSGEGKELLAHELAHTVQQEGSIRRKVDPDEKKRLENEFDAFVKWRVEDIREKNKGQQGSEEEIEFLKQANDFRSEMEPPDREGKNNWGGRAYNKAFKEKGFLMDYRLYVDDKAVKTKQLGSQQVAKAVMDLEVITKEFNSAILAMTGSLPAAQKQFADLGVKIEEFKNPSNELKGDIGKVGSDETRTGFEDQYAKLIAQYEGLLALITNNISAIPKKEIDLKKYIGDLQGKQESIAALNVALQAESDPGTIRLLYDQLTAELSAMNTVMGETWTALSEVISDPAASIGVGEAQQVENKLKEDVRYGLLREKLLKTASREAKIVAAVTLAEGAMKEDGSNDGMRDIAWVYKNLTRSLSFDKAMRRSSAYRGNQAHYATWISYFDGNDNPTEYKLGESTKHIGLDVLDFVVRDVMPDKGEKNPFPTFTSQGYHGDLRINYPIEHEKGKWHLARQFVHLWLNGDIPREEFISRMEIVGDDPKYRTFLFNADAVELYLTQIKKLPNAPTDVPDIIYNDEVYQDGWLNMRNLKWMKINGKDIPKTR